MAAISYFRGRNVVFILSVTINRSMISSLSTFLYWYGHSFFAIWNNILEVERSLINKKHKLKSQLIYKSFCPSLEELEI